VSQALPITHVLSQLKTTLLRQSIQTYILFSISYCYIRLKIYEAFVLWGNNFNFSITNIKNEKEIKPYLCFYFFVANHFVIFLLQ